MVLRKLDIHMEKTEARPLSLTLHKNNSKWVKHLNVRPGTYKLLEENIGKTLENVGICNVFLN
jgi:hypothetical protein